MCLLSLFVLQGCYWLCNKRKSDDVTEGAAQWDIQDVAPIHPAKRVKVSRAAEACRVGKRFTDSHLEYWEWVRACDPSNRRRLEKERKAADVLSLQTRLQLTHCYIHFCYPCEQKMWLLTHCYKHWRHFCEHKMWLWTHCYKHWFHFCYPCEQKMWLWCVLWLKKKCCHSFLLTSYITVKVT